MNPQLFRILLASLWVASVAGAYFAGRQMPDPAKALTAQAPPAAGSVVRKRTPAGDLSDRADQSDRTDLSAESDPSQLGKGETKDIPSLIESIRKAFGDGRGPMFGGTGMFRVMGQLMELSPEEVQLALGEVGRTVDDPRQKMMLQSMLLGRMAETDPKGALAQVEKLAAESDGSARTDGLYFSVVGALSKSDPNAAWKWYTDKRDSGTLPEEGARLSGMIFAGMAAKNLDMALSQMGDLESLDERNSAASGIASAATDPASWQRILDSTQSFEGDSGKEARSAMMRQWASMDYEATTGLLNAMPANERQDLIDSASWGLMRSSPEKGAEFLMQNSSPEKLSERYSTVMNSWGDRDPNAAGEWLNSQPPSPAQDRARANFARTVVRKDPEAGLAWAQTVTEPKQRTDAIRDVYRQWSRRDAQAADAALAGTGLNPQQVEEIKVAARQQGSGGDGFRGFRGPPF